MGAPMSRRRLRARSLACRIFLASILGAAPGAVSAEYVVDSGDVIEVSVFGINDLRQRGAVNVDGELSVPMVGHLKVAGRTLSDIRSTIQNLLGSKEFRHRAADGREDIALRPEQISVDIIEYRPLFVSGDVSRPGSQTYRPKMTVRAAIALAGGFDAMRFRIKDPFLEAVDLRAEYQTLWTDFARERAQRWRVQAELDGKPQEDLNIAIQPVPKDVLDEIARSTQNQKKSDDTTYQNELSFLRRMQQEADKHLVLSIEQQMRDQEAERIENDNMDKTKDLYQKSIVPANRLVEQQRLSILAATRVLQTSTQVAQSRKDREDANRRIGRLDDERRTNLLAKLQESTIKLDAIRNKIQAVGEKLVYTGVVRSQLVHGPSSKPDITIYRKNDQGISQSIAADEDAELMPGDVVDVRLRAASDVDKLVRGANGQ
ncbi:polysaccharide biosynthesis/export family protein [Methylobacterium durans]|uniref:polysaccharide biosynthesis/export family protein n=1 Tax=Methylobacterium durans TaxID=2202825 RepID=UPI002AFE19B6|nr:polysaccharide biosynthesis/export family protein [Methylobacterium durans]MEA1834437.1 polysaccharide biosynthesis/export family protein [Methylobacterium durans]